MSSNMWQRVMATMNKVILAYLVFFSLFVAMQLLMLCTQVFNFIFLKFFIINLTGFIILVSLYRGKPYIPSLVGILFSLGYIFYVFWGTKVFYNEMQDVFFGMILIFSPLPIFIVFLVCKSQINHVKHRNNTLRL